MSLVDLEARIRASLSSANVAGDKTAIGAVPPVKLQFGTNGNAKLANFVAHFSLLSGHTCPGALECLSKRSLTEPKLKDGPHTRFRCFSASQEVLFPAVFQQRLKNWRALQAAKTTGRMADLIQHSLPSNYWVIRIHVAGDFFNQSYFDAWLKVAQNNPNILFYGYTKSLPYWVARLDTIPPNLRLTASRGGRHDPLIMKHQLREAVVVFHPEEAETAGLEIDHDDSHAMLPGPSFALLLHGSQPAQTEASRALTRLKKENIQNGYSTNRKSK